MSGSRGYAGANFALELAGQAAGWLKNASGGTAHAEVITETTGQKHLGAVHYDDLVLNGGAGMSKDFYTWVAEASNMTGGAQRKDGALLSCDFDGKVMSRLEWTMGLIKAISFPAFDAASKDPAFLTIKITPEQTRRHAGNGSRAASPLSRPPMWLSGNFRLKIDGLEDACAHVSRIAPMTISRELITESLGEVMIGRVSLGDLVISLPEARAQKFYAWFDSFVMGGNNSANQEKNGSLELLTPNASSTLFSLTFSHLGIYAITAASNVPGGEIRKIEVKMYCEAIRFKAL